jgi:pimeloyl-ACP methyl ester carboxylesterase
MLYFRYFCIDGLSKRHRLSRASARARLDRKQPTGHDRLTEIHNRWQDCSDYRLRHLLDLMHHRSPLEGSLMKLFAIGIAVMLAGFSYQASANPKSSHAMSSETTMIFTADSGEKVDAFEGSFTVPENRADTQSRTLTLRYVRFPATGNKTGFPIIYLAGGPGGSGIDTAKGRRFPLFMAMREFGDVIAFDQRGTGASNDMPQCTSSQKLAGTENISDVQYVKRHQYALRECLTFWKEKGIDVHGYTTPENVNDLEALRQHLGVQKLTLWGISYGSHLSLAAIKQMGDRIDKVVIASAEGLDQTIKLPARTDDYFGRVQDAINTQPKTKAAWPDIKSTMRRVHAKLEKAPIAIKVKQKDGTTFDYLWQRRDMQQAASATISDPVPLSLLLHLYDSLDKGDTKILDAVAPFVVKATEEISFQPMSVLMDIASGTGAARRALIADQAKTSLLATYLNQPVELEDVDRSLVLDDDFRTAPVSDVPLLLLSGTLDGRTYIESQREAVAGLSALQTVTIHNVGHNLFLASPEVTATIQDFMRGGNVDGREIDFPLTDLLTAGFSMMK